MAATDTHEIWIVEPTRHTEDNGTTVYSYYTEGVSKTHGWFCFEVDTISELAEELTTIGFDPTPYISTLPN